MFDGALWLLASPPEGATVTHAPINRFPEIDSISVAEGRYDFPPERNLARLQQRSAWWRIFES